MAGGQTGGFNLANHDRIDLYDSHAHLISDDHARYPQSPVPYGPNRPTRFAGGGVAVAAGVEAWKRFPESELETVGRSRPLRRQA